MADAQLATQANVKDFLTSEEVQGRVKKLLNKRAPQFTVSLMAALNNNPKLQECTPSTVLSAAINAAALDLPITPSLGFACLVPFYNSKKRVFEAQFQMMLRGYVQLAHRSMKYKSIASTKVYGGQLVKLHPLDGPVFDWDNKKSDTIIGYVSRFQLVNGFGSTLYMSHEEVEKHGTRYSKSYQQDKDKGWTSSLWTNDFEMMALKTVTKLNLARNGYLSSELQQAVSTDQGIIDGEAIEYLDGMAKLELPQLTDEDKQDISNEAEDLAGSLLDEATSQANANDV